MSRSWLFIILAAFAVAIVVIITSLGGVPASPAPAASAALSGYVVLPVDAPSSLIPGNIMLEKGAQTGSLIYEGLVTKGRTGKYEGWLATSWVPSEGGKVWTFSLVRNATWHDGVPCTCEDVKFTNDYMKAHNLTMAFVLSDVESIECPDPYTAVFTLSHPYSVFPDRLAQSPGIGVYPAHVFQNVADPASYVDNGPIGTGPFVFSERAPGILKLDTNPAYHGPAPEIAGVILKVVSGVDSRVIALRNGEIDAVPSLPTAVANSLGGEADIRVYTIPDTTGYEVAFNTGVYPGNNPEFRKALSHAVDRDRIATLLGSARPNPTTFLIPGVAGDFVDPDSVGMYDYDLAKAEAILAAAGLFRGADGTLRGPDGDPVELNIPLGGKASAGGADEKILAILREDLGKLGITIKTVAYESEKEYRKAMARAPVFIDGMPAMLHDDADDLVNFAYTPLGQENYYQYHDPDYDALAIEVRNTTDRESRKEIGYMMQKILAKDVPTIPVCSVDTIAAYRSDRFTGWEEETEATGLQDIRTLTRIRPAAA